MLRGSTKNPGMKPASRAPMRNPVRRNVDFGTFAIPPRDPKGGFDQ